MLTSTTLLRRASRAIAGGLVLLGITAAAACDAASPATATPQPHKGGTLYVNIGSGIGTLDPQVTYNATESNILRLTTRTLTTYRAEPGAAASEIVPDLATDTGRPSDDNSVWRFTLKPNVKWEGGEPVTCSQVKYGIERRFADILQGSVPYPGLYLADNATPYKGPWLDNNNGGKGLESIKCVDERNIVFTLKQPVGDFGYALAMVAFAPVLPEKDTKLDYGQKPYSNGPYKIVSRDDKNMVMERNRFWTEANDQVRKAYPDKIVFDFREDSGGAVTNDLIENEGNARNTVMLDGNVAPNFLQQVVNDPDLTSRAIQGPTGGVRFMAINTKRVPDLACRKALIYAFNKRKWRAVNGGSVTGDYATTIIPPGMKAYEAFDLYDSLANPEGKPDESISIMDAQQKAGKPCKSTITIAYSDTPLRRRLMATVVEAYQAAEIQVNAVPLEASTYYQVGVGDPTNTYDMMLVGWIPDWANGSAILPPIYDGRNIAPLDKITGHGANNVNWSLLNDNAINEQIKLAQGETSPERQWALWGDLDKQIQSLGVAIPILYERALRLAGSNVAGGYISPAFGMPDLTALGLIQP